MVTIKPTFRVEPGEYALVLESYDSSSKAQSALKTTTTMVSVLPREVRFATKLSLQTLVFGEATSWDLPEILVPTGLALD